MIWHITPVNDLKEHKESSQCECNPSVRVCDGGDLLITHNSYDKRELFEEILKDSLIEITLTDKF